MSASSNFLRSWKVEILLKISKLLVICGSPNLAHAESFLFFFSFPSLMFPSIIFQFPFHPKQQCNLTGQKEMKKKPKKFMGQKEKKKVRTAGEKKNKTEDHQAYQGRREKKNLK